MIDAAMSGQGDYKITLHTGECHQFGVSQA